VNVLYAVHHFSRTTRRRMTVLTDVRRQTPTLAEREKAKAQALSHLQKTTDVTDWNCVGIEFVAETPNRVLLSI
jgi:hypothetical protein